MKATKEQFEAFLDIRDSGVTNMMDVHTVIDIADQIGVKITREQCLDIIHNFSDYEKEYS